jgi:hypothetical protein
LPEGNGEEQNDHHPRRKSSRIEPAVQQHRDADHQQRQQAPDPEQTTEFGQSRRGGSDTHDCILRDNHESKMGRKDQA